MIFSTTRTNNFIRFFVNDRKTTILKLVDIYIYVPVWYRSRGLSSGIRMDRYFPPNRSARPSLTVLNLIPPMWWEGRGWEKKGKEKERKMKNSFYARVSLLIYVSAEWRRGSGVTSWEMLNNDSKKKKKRKNGFTKRFFGRAIIYLHFRQHRSSTCWTLRRC